MPPTAPPDRPSLPESVWVGMAAAWLAFLAGVVVPLVGTFLLIEHEVAACEPDGMFCGLAYLLLIPVLFAGLLVIGPVACAATLSISGRPRAGATGWRCTVVVIALILTSMMLNLVLSLVPGYLSSPLVVVIGAPLGGIVATPLVARLWALAGSAAVSSAAPVPRGTTWESTPG